MENMTFTRTTTVTLVEEASIQNGLTRFRQGMSCIVSLNIATPSRPATIATLTYEAVHDDVERVIASVAQVYTDQSCPNLHFDEITAECRAKTAKLVNDGWLGRATSRGEFFRVFATSIKNHVRSLVLKYRYTEKRTGVKPPPRRKREDVLNGTADQHEHRKNVEVSLDDPDSGLQVPDAHHTDEREAAEMVDDFKRLLTPLEQLVFGQLTEPNMLALLHAQADAHSGKGSLRVKVKTVHLADGIGMTVEQFENTVLTIRDKIKVHRAMNEDQQAVEARFSAAVSTLAQLFNVQVPNSQYVSTTLIRRLFTIAARTEYQKVNTEVATLLTTVGAMVPKFVGSHKDCFGWHSRTEQHCHECSVSEACATRAASVGLDSIKPSAKLIGPISRIPVVLPRMVESTSRFRPLAAQKVAAQPKAAPSGVLDFIREVYEEHVETKNGVSLVYVGIKGETTSNLRRLFCIESADPFSLRFCNPKLTTCLRLNTVGRMHYLPLNLSVEEAIKLVNQHTAEVLKKYGKGTHAA